LPLAGAVAVRPLADRVGLSAVLTGRGFVPTAWVLQHPAVASAIVGVRTPEQLDVLDRAASLVIENVALTRLKEIFDINRGRGIGQGRSPQAYAW
jgi:predicted oxidoreductase